MTGMYAENSELFTAVIHGCHGGNSAIAVPPSKSIGHRALIAASLADGISELEGIRQSGDIQATIQAMKQFGAEFIFHDDRVMVRGVGLRGCTGIVNCRDSASTLRFLIPLAALSEKESVFCASAQLMRRPLSVYEDIFSQRDLLFSKSGYTIRFSGPLGPGEYEAAGNISSQFISGLLFALPLLAGDSTLTIRPPFESKPYVGLTRYVLAKSGIDIEETDGGYHIRGNQRYQPFNASIEGDDSQAAFFACLAMIIGKPIHITNMSHESRQGDRVVIPILRRMGAKIRETDTGYLFVPQPLHSTEIDLTDCPDLGPALFVLASRAKGETVFRNCGRLRLKECDRIAAMEEEMTKCGFRFETDGSTVRIMGGAPFAGNVTLSGHGDHRVVMALSILAACAGGPVRITGCEAVRKSYPAFFEDLASLGVRISREELML